MQVLSIQEPEFRPLLEDELEEVTGGAVPVLAAVGAAAGAIGYWASTPSSQQSAAGHLMAAGSGALGGAVGAGLWAGYASSVAQSIGGTIISGIGSWAAGQFQ